MKKFIALGLAVILGGCATQFGEKISTAIAVAQNFEITQNQLDTARNAYDGAVLAPLAKYASLPRCKLNQKFTMNIPCHDRKILKQIREEDKIIARAIDDTQTAITAGDSKGAIAAYKALNIAIELAKSLISQTGVSLLGV